MNGMLLDRGTDAVAAGKDRPQESAGRGSAPVQPAGVSEAGAERGVSPPPGSARGPATAGSSFGAALALAAALSAGFAVVGAVMASRQEGWIDAPSSRSAPATGEPAWAAHLRTVDTALARRDVSAAELAWHAANAEALRDRRWQGMLAVGDAALRIGAGAGLVRPAAPRARRAYLTALLRARQQRSLEGVLEATDHFAMLGDRDVVEQGIRIAHTLAGPTADAHPRHRLRALTERLAFLESSGAGWREAGIEP